MTGDASWSRIKVLFQEAIQRNPHERAAFLEQACDGDRALQREVESLLTAHQEAGDFAERPAIETLAESSRGEGGYRLLSLLGAGGMGEVYRARDLTLGRDVAVKILPPILAADPNRLARFDREARLLASLNHPNICSIHGIADINGTPGLVLELVEGQTLAERIAAGSRRPMGVSETLTIARDIARALEAAHDKGIIHRDLKPANIRIAPDGVVKVLDFGLAKATADSASEPQPGDFERTRGPQAIAVGSQDGMPLGTAAYMSPEQARGEPIDKRTDIWAFGSVLFEMLTGRRAAKGETVSEIVASVLEGEPDWTAVPATTPPGIERLVHRCLEKDVKRRLRDIGDARLEIEDALIDPQGAGGRPAAVRAQTAVASRQGRPWLVAAMFVLGVIPFLVWSRSAPSVAPQALQRISAELGTDAALVMLQFGQGSALGLSPDGKMLVFAAQQRQSSARQIYVRRLGELQATPLNGTDGALNPFFSPDSRWIGFFADGKLKKIPASGGGAVTICLAKGNRGGAWGEDDMITFAPDRAGAPLSQVPASGGEPKPLIALGQGEITQRWPQMLNGGKAVLFTGNNRPDGFDEANVVVQSLPNGPRKTLVDGAYYGRYLPSGHLLYVHNSTLFAAPFDLRRLELTGPAVPALEGVAIDMPVGAAELAISETGTVAYLPPPEPVNYMHAPIDWMDRDGKSTPMMTTPTRWLYPRFSPDGRRLALDLFDGTQHDVWAYDWSRDALLRLTVDPADDGMPVWTPDGRRIVFTSTRQNPLVANLYWQRVDMSGDVQRLTESDRRQSPGAWHPSEKILAFTEYDSQTDAPTLMMLRVDGDEASGWRPAEPTVFLSGADFPRFSPDGRWLAYISRAPGRIQTEVYVRPFRGSGGPWQISEAGGNNPAWSSTRRELFFGTPDHQIITVTYSASGDSFVADKPRALPNSGFSPRVVGQSFDLHPDGERLALAKAPESGTAPKRDHVIFIFNFLEELRRIAPVGSP